MAVFSLYSDMLKFISTYKQFILGYIMGALCIGVAWLITSNNELKNEIVEVSQPKVEIKTVTKTDTVTITRTVPKPEYVTETIIKTDTIQILNNDTIVEKKPIDYTKRQYCTIVDNDTVKGEIKATVSGYEATLDTLSYNLNIYPKTVTNTITSEITKYKTKHWNFTLGVGAGYGLINRKPDIFIGGMVGYSF